MLKIKPIQLFQSPDPQQYGMVAVDKEYRHRFDEDTFRYDGQYCSVSFNKGTNEYTILHESENHATSFVYMPGQLNQILTDFAFPSNIKLTVKAFGRYTDGDWYVIGDVVITITDGVLLEKGIVLQDLLYIERKVLDLIRGRITKPVLEVIGNIYPIIDTPLAQMDFSWNGSFGKPYIADYEVRVGQSSGFRFSIRFDRMTANKLSNSWFSSTPSWMGQRNPDPVKWTAIYYARLLSMWFNFNKHPIDSRGMESNSDYSPAVLDVYKEQKRSIENESIQHSNELLQKFRVEVTLSGLYITQNNDLMHS